MTACLFVYLFVCLLMKIFSVGVFERVGIVNSFVNVTNNWILIPWEVLIRSAFMHRSICIYIYSRIDIFKHTCSPCINACNFMKYSNFDQILDFWEDFAFVSVAIRKALNLGQQSCHRYNINILDTIEKCSLKIIQKQNLPKFSNSSYYLLINWPWRDFRILWTVPWYFSKEVEWPLVYSKPTPNTWWILMRCFLFNVRNTYTRRGEDCKKFNLLNFLCWSAQNRKP